MAWQVDLGKASGERWNPFDAGALPRPAPEPSGMIDPAFIEEAVAAFERAGFHGPLNHCRVLDPLSR